MSKKDKDTAVTGGTGSPGVTGGTGGTGRKGSSKPKDANFSDTMRGLTDDAVPVQDYSRMEMLREYHGATGGEGPVPEDFQEVLKNEDAPTLMITEMRKMFSGMDDDELIQELGTRYHKCAKIIGKVNAVGAIHAIPIGLGANILKSRLVHGSWQDYSAKHLLKPFGMSKRTLEKYMAIATLYKVADYVAYGVEALYEIATSYNHLPSEEKDTIGQDVVAYFLEKMEADASHQDRKDRMEAAVWVMKLKRHGVDLTVELMEEFLAGGGSLSKARLLYLKELKEADGAEAPVDFLNQVISHNGSWEKALPAEEAVTTADPGNQAPVEFEPEESPAQDAPTSTLMMKVPSITEQTVSLRQTIRFVLESDEVEDFDIQELDLLAQDIAALKARMETKQTEAA